jgi:hypothetical protein
MQLSVLVDRPLDPHQQTLGLEPRQMLLKVERRAGFLLLAAVLGWLVEHVLIFQIVMAGLVPAIHVFG